ncbi:hypothetical protein C8R44DRAFT_634671 [Mycena epipterygia]|nr:hypothetical protein C8R44DRAFT_634671 [Mycena epipterygia]
MPKSAKKRKDKAADFSKSRLKLGKGKRLATNAIDTSFKARSIALPSQSITLDKNEDAPTTKRRLTFDDLITHIKHYSAGTRKDAIAGLRELLDAHPEILESSLTTLINAAVRVVGDEDATVRKSLLEFFVWMFPRIPTENLAPHATSLLLFTTSAQTHIFPEIRVDAIRFLNLFLEYIPAATVAGWNQTGTENGSRVLEGYLGILNAGTKFGETDGPMKATSTASVVLTAASKLVVLQSLSTFLRCAVSARTAGDRLESPSVSSIDTWYLASWFQTPEAYGVFDQLLRPRHSQADHGRLPHRIWQAEVDLEFEDEPPCHYPLLGPFGSKWTLQQLSESVDGAGNTANGGGENSTFVRHLARTLHSTLISTFLDCAPSVFSPNGKVDETQAKLIVAVAEITRHLYGAILQSTFEKDSERPVGACVDLKSILGYMAPYFPFKLSGAREIKAEQIFQALNLIYCELTSLLILTSETVPTRGKRAVQGQQGSKDGLQVQTERVSDYVIQLLKGESLSTSQLGRPLTQTAYTALLPTIWSLINNANPQLQSVSSDVLQATLEHASRVSSKSALKQVTIEFIARIVLLHTEPQFKGHLNISTDAAETVAEWMKHLPKCLWELGSTNLAATEIILRFLLILCQRRSRLADTQTVGLLRSQIVPYFSITHAVRGQVPGPYTKLPPASPIRRLALDVAVMIGDDPSLSSAVNAAVLGTKEEPYWHNISTAN